MASSVFYRTGDDVLARRRDGGMYASEVFQPKARKWASYPELDTLHDAREVPADHALAFAREQTGDQSVSMGDLESTGTGGDFGDIYESAAPLKRIPVRAVVR